MADIGRPTVMTPETIARLEDGFLKGMTDKEACLYADIAMATLYNYGEKFPDFLERKEMLKENVKLHARINIAENIIEKKDKLLSQWFMERKVKDEFSLRNEITGKDGEAIKAKLDLSSIPTDELERIASEGRASETGTS